MFCYSWSTFRTRRGISFGAVSNLWCEQAWFWFHDVSNCKLCCAHRVRVRKVNLGCVCTHTLKGWLCPQLNDVTLLECQLGHLPFMAAQFPALEFYQPLNRRHTTSNQKGSHKSCLTNFLLLLNNSHQRFLFNSIQKLIDFFMKRACLYYVNCNPFVISCQCDIFEQLIKILVNFKNSRTFVGNHKLFHVRDLCSDFNVTRAKNQTGLGLLDGLI
jgi:hypothetical protein